MSDRGDASSVSRRGFLRGAGLGLGAAMLARIADIRHAFADQAAAAIDRDAGRIPKDAYDLDPAVVYLNHASIGTVPRAVQRAHQRYLTLCEENPWLYMWGGAWEEPREVVRSKAAALVGADPDDVAFTHNTTETFNLLAQGLPLGAGDEVLFPSLNHSGASVCFEDQATRRGFSVRRFPLPTSAAGDPDSALACYDDAIGTATRLLVLPHVDNMLGLRHPVARIASLARQRGVRWVAVDGAQTVGMLPVDVGELGIDVYATSAHKWLQAPKGLGLTFLSPGVREALRPMWVTWGQARWQGSVRIFEDYGTRNLPAVLALGDAIDFHRQIGDDARRAHHRRLRKYAQTAVERAPNLTWRSSERLADGSALYAIEIAGQKASDAARELFEQRGIVLRPFETDEINALRISPNLANTTDDLDQLFAALETINAADHS